MTQRKIMYLYHHHLIPEISKKAQLEALSNMTKQKFVLQEAYKTSSFWQHVIMYTMLYRTTASIIMPYQFIRLYLNIVLFLDYYHYINGI